MVLLCAFLVFIRGLYFDLHLQQLRLCGGCRSAFQIVLIEIHDAVHRANRNASPAAGAGGFVNDGNAVDHMDGVRRALLFAALAAYAGRFALQPCQPTRRFVSAQYNNCFILWQHLNDAERAGCNAHAATGANIVVNNRNAFPHRDCAKRAAIYAVA